MSNVCVCPTGFYGNSCQNSFVSPLLGTYNCSRGDCTQPVSGVNTWQSVVSTASVNAGYTLVISNFNNTGIALTATVDSFGNVNTDLANGQSGTSAKGKFVAPTMTLRYFTFSVASGIVGAECTMALTKE